MLRTSTWQALTAHVALFLVACSVLFPTARIDAAGRFELAASEVQAQGLPSSPAFQAPATSFEQHPAHTPVVTVARQLSVLAASAVVDGRVSITYRVFNQRPEKLSSVLLKTTLLQHVSLLGSSIPPTSASGRALAWVFEELGPFESRSVEVRVQVADLTEAALDAGAEVYADYKARKVSASTVPAFLIVGAVAPDLLACTIDADCADPIVVAKAAQLGNDPQAIFRFVRDELAYEVYEGSLRGSRGTLWSRAGNALDKSSLLIALLRASGIPARYAAGQLSTAQAQQLIGSMYNPGRASLGYYPEGVETLADPLNDTQSLAEASDHAWVEALLDGDLVAADPSFSTSAWGESHAPVGETFSEVPSARRHKFNIKVRAELLNSLFSAGVPAEKTALDHTFNTVELAGKPVTVSHLITSQAQSGFIFFNRQHTYTPHLIINDGVGDPAHDRAITGTSYQELFSNFAGMSDVLTGVFVETTSTAPSGASTSNRRTIYDRIGYAARRFGGSPSFPPDLGERRAFEPTDAYTVLAGGSLIDENAWVPFAQLMKGMEPGVRQALATYEQTESDADLATLEAALRPANRMQTAIALLMHAAASDKFLGDLRRSLGVSAYFDEARVLVSHAEANEGGYSLSLDLRENTPRVSAGPGEPVRISSVFQALRGQLEGSLESEIMQRVTGKQSADTMTVFDLAYAQNIPFATLISGDEHLVDNLRISAEARGRILEALAEGKVVFTPSAPVTIAGAETVGWLEVDPQSGETIPVMENGGHQALIGYAALLNDNMLKKLAWLVIGMGHGIADGTFTFLGDVLSNVHTKPIDEVLRQAKLNLIDRAINKAISEGISLTVSNNVGKQLAKAVQCFLKFTPANAAGGGAAGNVETNPDKFVPCLVTRLIEAGVIDPLFKLTTGKEWYKWGVIAGIVGIAAYFDYALGIDPEVLPFRVSDFSTPQPFARGDTFYSATQAAGAYDLTAQDLTLSGWLDGASRSSFYTSQSVQRVQTGAVLSGPFSQPLAGSQVLVRGASVQLGGSDVREGVTLVGAAGSANVASEAGAYAFSATGSAAHVIFPSQAEYDVQVGQGGRASFEVGVATSLADDYTIDVEAPLGWGASVSGRVVTVVPRPGATPSVYPVFVTVQSKEEPALLVGYTVDVTLGAGVPSVQVEIVPDPLFTVAVAQMQLSSAFRARITNTGPEADEFTLTFPVLPPGFELVASSDTVWLEPGASAEVGLYLAPTEVLPETGSLASFTLRVESLSDPEVGQTVAQSFVVPQVHELGVSASPHSLAASPGTSLQTTLTFSALGNVSETFSIAADAPSGLSLSGLPSQLTLAAGQSRSFDVALQLAASATLNRELQVEVVADLCGTTAPGSCSVLPATRSGFFSVIARSEAVARLATASQGALEAGFNQLASELDAFADALVQLEANPSTPGACESAERAALNLRKIAATEPSLLGLADGFAALAATAASCDPAQLQQQTRTLGDSLEDAVTEYRDYNLSASLSGTKQVIPPGASANAVVSLQNVGQKSVTVRLASTSAAGLSVSFERNNFVLAPSSSAEVAVTLRPSAEGQHAFSVSVRAEEAATVRTFSGTVVSMDEPYNVMLVDTVPRIINPGDDFQVLAHIVNVANVRASVEVLTEISSLTSDEVVYVSNPALALTLPVGNRLDPYTLDFVDTTGWDEGDYRITVMLNDPQSGHNLGEGSTIIHVGTPVRGSVSVGPELVPPGSAQVRTQIEVQRLVAGSSTNLGFTPSALDEDRINWAAASRGARVTATGWSNFALLTDELGTGTETYTTSSVANARVNPLSVDLGAVRSIDEVEFSLWNGDYRFYRYRLEGSRDGVSFAPLKDTSTREARGRQRITFDPTELRYLRLFGLHGSANTDFHLIEELRAIGPASGTPVATQSVVIDAVAQGGTTFTRGKRVELNAGVYEVRYEAGALSPYASNADNAGKSWMIRHRVDIPAANKLYQPHWVGPSLTAYSSVAAAEADNPGATYLIYMPAHGSAYFWFEDGTATDNRGSLTLSLRQISGATSSLLARVRDAMTRSVTWQQSELAAWDNWGVNGAGACYGCHIQSQGMAGLAQSLRKLPDLPVHHSIFDLARSSFRGWQDQAGWVSPRHGGSFRSSQTSLWAWSTSYFFDEDYLSLAGPVANSLDYLFTTQGATGWNYDHGDTGVDLYADGQPSAAHTAGNIRALARYLSSNIKDQRLDVPSQAAPAEVYFADSEPNVIDVQLGQLSGVTGIQLAITDTFANNKNFVINEVQFFNGTQQVAVSAAEASFSQSSFPIANTINGTLTANGDGWAHSPRNVTTQPALGLWKFSAPVNIDRVRVHQRYDSSNHKVRRLKVSQTTAATPTLASAFTSIPTLRVVNGLDEPVVLERLVRAADMFLDPAWPYTRNLRTAAQTLLGLNDAMPFLNEAKRSTAQARIAQIQQWLRGQQREGGWVKTGRESSGPQPFQSAQALDALLTAASSSVDPVILEATEYLLNTQQRDGSWVSVDLDRELAATTWVEIALPTLFELLGSLTFRVEHDLPTERVSWILGSESPAVAADSTSTQLVWNGLTRETSEILSVDLQLTDLEAGEVLPVSLGSRIHYASVDASGTVELPPVNVAVKHVLAVEPATQQVAPSGTATFSATVENLLTASDTFAFEVLGLPATWVNVPAPAAVPAGARVTVPIVVTVPPSADLAQYAFTVRATSSLGVRDSAGAELVVSGEAPPVTLDRSGVVVDVLPALASAGQGTPAQFTARVTNIGAYSDTFALSAVLPSGLSAQFEQTLVRVEPGYGQSVTVDFTVLVPAGSPAGDRAFTVAATSTTQASVRGTDAATVRVLPLGVDIAITPEAGAADDTFVVTVTNTGTQADTFALQLGGGVALGATALPATVGLSAGSSRSFPVSFANLGVLSQGAAVFAASATSQTDPTVRDEDSSTLAIPASLDFAAQVAPESVSFVGLGVAEFSVLLTNLGNGEDALRVEVVRVTGPGVATFGGPLGGSGAIEAVRLPATAQGAVPLLVQLNAFGAAQVELAVMSLTTGVVRTLSVRATAVNPNRPPLVDAGGPYELLAGEEALLTATASDSDGPSALSFSWSFLNQPAGSTLTSSDLSGADGPAVVFTPTVRGEYQLQVVVSDGDASASDTASVLVQNNPPVAEAGLDVNAMTFDLIVLDGSASFDADGDQLTFSWTMEARPAGSFAQLDDPLTPRPRFVLDAPGSYTLQLTVSDGEASATDTVVVVASPLVPPNALVSVPATSAVGERVELDGSGSNDPDNAPQPLTYAWQITRVPAGSRVTTASLDSSTAARAFLVTDVAGDYEVLLTVSDGRSTASAAAVVHAVRINRPPVADAGPDVSIDLGLVSLDGTGSHDPDLGPEPLSYAWRLVSVPVGSALSSADIVNPTLISASFTADALGSYVLELGVFDGVEWSYDNVAILVSMLMCDLNGDTTVDHFDIRELRSRLKRSHATGEVRVDFDCEQVTVYTCKDLSNVVLELEDGSLQRYEGLSGHVNSFAGTGGNQGSVIVGVWVKAGANFSGDGPGYGERFDAPAETCNNVSDTISWNTATCCKIPVLSGDPADFNRDLCLTQSDVDGCSASLVENTALLCNDRADNDVDNLVDCDDPSCRGIGVCALVVNECLPRPSSGGEWIELWNPTASPVDASGARVDDDSGGTPSKVLAPGSVVPANGALLVPLTGNVLNDSGSDSCRLLGASEREISALAFKNAPAGQAWARSPNVTGAPVWRSTLTPGAANP